MIPRVLIVPMTVISDCLRGMIPRRRATNLMAADFANIGAACSRGWRTNSGSSTFTYDQKKGRTFINSGMQVISVPVERGDEGPAVYR